MCTFEDLNKNWQKWFRIAKHAIYIDIKKIQECSNATVAICAHGLDTWTVHHEVPSPRSDKLLKIVANSPINSEWKLTAKVDSGKEEEL